MALTDAMGAIPLSMPCRSNSGMTVDGQPFTLSRRASDAGVGLGLEVANQN
ncbi:hypothetical protein [Salinispora pacifica]|uniref:hypothetical protein n=1 Tax=Salinispora pacifica TaxID=351187 RepID=UPI00039F4F80|nr:hypothetical protein [Salinispora pacifica]